MIEIRKTEIFAKWIDSLNDIRARARIQARIERLAAGNPGDVKAVGEGVSELRIDYGPGYRVYYKKARTEADHFIGWWRQEHTGQGHQNRLASGKEFIGVYYDQNRNYPI